MTSLTKLPFSGEYSMNNIPIPRRKEYKQKLVRKTELLIGRVRWKYWWATKDKRKNQNQSQPPQVEFEEDKKENYGFRTANAPPRSEELEPFENAMWDMVKNVKYRKYSNKILNQLEKDLKYINASKNVIVKSDKNRNYYEISVEDYNKIMLNNITPLYRKCNEDEIRNVDKETQDLSRKMKLSNVMQKYTPSEAYVTVKDHKEDVPGKCSKIILQKVTEEVNHKIKVNQWKSTKEVIDWFENIEDKSNFRFFTFDIVAYYPSISQELLDRALEFARSKMFISDFDLKVIRQSRKTFLFHKETPWVKKGDTNGFDVAMGAFDGAECCEIVGIYLLKKMTSGENAIFPKSNCGLYRDDGLAILETGTTNAHKVKLKLEELYKEEGLKIKVKANLITTDFLYVKLNLQTEKYQPYRKPGSKIVYIDYQSNHPPSVKRAMPGGIQTRLSTLSSNNETFENEARPYEHELNQRGYKCKLKYTKTNNNFKNKKKRKRKIIFYNPPWNDAVSTDVARRTFNIIRNHFREGTLLGRLCNKRK